MDDDNWVKRMAARNRDREQARINAQLSFLPRDDGWLNGWPRVSQTQVLIGTATRCIACGRTQGITCVAIPADWEPPGPTPAWPFTEDDCPVDGCRDWSPFYDSAT